MHSVEKRKILSHQKSISSNQLLCKLFSKNRYFHEIFAKNACEKISLIFTLWCGNCENLLTSLCYLNNYGKLTHLLLKFTIGISRFSTNRVDFSFLQILCCLKIQNLAPTFFPKISKQAFHYWWTIWLPSIFFHIEKFCWILRQKSFQNAWLLKIVILFYSMKNRPV